MKQSWEQNPNFWILAPSSLHTRPLSLPHLPHHPDKTVLHTHPVAYSSQTQHYPSHRDWFWKEMASDRGYVTGVLCTTEKWVGCVLATHASSGTKYLIFITTPICSFCFRASTWSLTWKWLLQVKPRDTGDGHQLTRRLLVWSVPQPREWPAATVTCCDSASLETIVWSESHLTDNRGMWDKKAALREQSQWWQAESGLPTGDPAPSCIPTHGPNRRSTGRIHWVTWKSQRSTKAAVKSIH